MTQTAIMASAGPASMAAPADHDSGIRINLGAFDSEAAIIFKAGDFEAQVFLGAQGGVCTVDNIILCGTKDDEVLAGQGVLTTAGVRFRIMVDASIDDDMLMARRLGAIMKVDNMVLTVDLDTAFSDKTLFDLMAPRRTLVDLPPVERFLSFGGMDTIMVGASATDGAISARVAQMHDDNGMVSYLIKIDGVPLMLNMAAGGVVDTVWRISDKVLEEVSLVDIDGAIAVQELSDPRIAVAPKLAPGALQQLGQLQNGAGRDVIGELERIALRPAASLTGQDLSELRTRVA